jgi:hypothetical protein
MGRVPAKGGRKGDRGCIDGGSGRRPPTDGKQRSVGRAWVEAKITRTWRGAKVFAHAEAGIFSKVPDSNEKPAQSWRIGGDAGSLAVRRAAWVHATGAGEHRPSARMGATQAA